MWKRPIRKLVIRASVRQIHAVEACGLRYLGFFASLVAVPWIFWSPSPARAFWLVYPLLVLALVVLLRPWHREFHLGMDSPKLRMTRMLLGVIPLAQIDYAWEGRRLAIESRTTRTVKSVDGDSGLGRLTFVLPFPISLLVSSMVRSSGNELSVTLRTMLRLKGAPGMGTEDLAPLKDAHVALPLLEAVRQMLPEHVESQP